MIQYPLILIPDAIASYLPLEKPPKPIPPVAPQPPILLPPEPQPLNPRAFFIWGIGGLFLSLFPGLLVTLFSPGWGVILMTLGLVVILILMLLKTYIELKSFPQRKEAHEMLQQQYLLSLDRYAIALFEFERKETHYKIALQDYLDKKKAWDNNYQQLKSVLNQVISYQGRTDIIEKKYSDFEAHLRRYFKEKIQTGLIIKNSNSHQEVVYTPDFAYIDLDLNLHIDIEINEPYPLETREPSHYLEQELERDKYFLTNLWIIIKFSEEQIIKYPKNCCKEIAQVINQITGNSSILKLLVNESDLQSLSG